MVVVAVASCRKRHVVILLDFLSEMFWVFQAPILLYGSLFFFFLSFPIFHGLVDEVPVADNIHG